MEQERRDIIGEHQRRWQELEKRGKILRARRHRQERATRGIPSDESSEMAAQRPLDAGDESKK